MIARALLNLLVDLRHGVVHLGPGGTLEAHAVMGLALEEAGAGVRVMTVHIEKSSSPAHIQKLHSVIQIKARVSQRTTWQKHGMMPSSMHARIPCFQSFVPSARPMRRLHS